MQKKCATYLGLLFVRVAIEPPAGFTSAFWPQSAPASAAHHLSAAGGPAADSAMPASSPSPEVAPHEPARPIPTTAELSPTTLPAAGPPSSAVGAPQGPGGALPPHTINPRPTSSSQPPPPPPPTAQIPGPTPAPGWSTAPAPFILGPVNLYRGVPSNWPPTQRSSGPLVWSQCLSDAAAQAGLQWRKTGTPGPLAGCAVGGSTTGCGAFVGRNQRAASNSYFCYANSASYGSRYFGAAWIVDNSTGYAYLYEMGV